MVEPYAMHVEGHPTGPILATRSMRFLAVFIDGLVVGLVTSPFRPRPELELDGRLGFIVMLAAFLAINVWFMKRGQTIGKWLLGLRIVSVDTGRPLPVGQLITRRYLPGWIAGLLPRIGGVYGLVNVLMIFREDRRCLHDVIAGTHVVIADSAPVE